MNRGGPCAVVYRLFGVVVQSDFVSGGILDTAKFVWGVPQYEFPAHEFPRRDYDGEDVCEEDRAAEEAGLLAQLSESDRDAVPCPWVGHRMRIAWASEERAARPRPSCV